MYICTKIYIHIIDISGKVLSNSIEYADVSGVELMEERSLYKLNESLDCQYFKAMMEEELRTLETRHKFEQEEKKKKQ